MLVCTSFVRNGNHNASIILKEPGTQIQLNGTLDCKIS